MRENKEKAKGRRGRRGMEEEVVRNHCCPIVYKVITSKRGKEIYSIRRKPHLNFFP